MTKIFFGLDGILAFILWDIVIVVLEPQTQGNFMRHSKRKQHMSKNNGVKQWMVNLDFVHPIAHTLSQRASMYSFEDSDAIVEMTIRGRSVTMRHVSRTHRVDFGLLFCRINLDPRIQIKYINTNQQIADILTTSSFSNLATPHLHICNQISFFRPYRKRTMSKRNAESSQKVPQPNRGLCATCQLTLKWRRTTKQTMLSAWNTHSNR